MAKLCSLKFSYILFVVVYFISLIANSHAASGERKLHIVYMGALREGETSTTSSYHASMLQDVVDSNFLGQSLVRSYTRSFNAFAANLTEEERQKLESLDEVVSVFPSRTLQPQTTKSWDFMGVPENVHRIPAVESNIILGVIDTGIWPESESFSDHGFGPVPKKWKGECKGGQNFTCNKKIIGARWYNSYSSTKDNARDIEGHGSHTASTAAGNPVKNASFYGIASGTARGGVPSSRIAVYKTCFEMGCQDADILAAFDDAIADGVDMITISLGRSDPVDFTSDSIAIGAFHAMEKGILTVHSAGNSGGIPADVASVAPWLFTIGASTMRRRIIDNVVLGNGKTFTGYAVNSFNLHRRKFPLAYGKDISKTCSEKLARECTDGCLDSNLVRGKIVVCNSIGGVIEPHRAGAIGLILQTGGPDDASFVFGYPTSVLSVQDYKVLMDYLNSTKTPQATILKSKSAINFDAPVAASFSSKGPNRIIPEILKPDVVAPGVDILAAYSPVASTSEGDPLDKRSVKFNVLSGTSMACPHTAGAAAYVKTFRPNWSPSAIKSALMTTARRMNSTKNKEGEFAYGAGFIDPTKAVHPGLVYETFREDYKKMLCSLKYDKSSLKRIFGDNSTCPKGVKVSPKDLNYPTMTSQVEENKQFSVNFSRTVTNVGLANSTYKAKITSPPQFDIRVEPDTLTFRAVNKKKAFHVTATGNMMNKSMMSASLEWSDGRHNVRSPIVVFTPVLYKS